MKTQHLASVFVRCMTILVVCVVARTASAGDAWLITNKNTVPEGDSLWLSFVVGDQFPLGLTATSLSNIASFSDSYQGVTRNVVGLTQQDRGLSVHRPIASRGIHIFACSMRPLFVESKAAFPNRTASRDNDSAAPIIERHWCFAKTIVEVLPQDTRDRSFETPIGHQLEIIPMSNPCRWQIDETVRVRVLLDGYPWGDVAVVMGHEDANEMCGATETRTDAKGIAVFTLTRCGHWYVKATLTRPTSDMGHARRESLRASLSFRVIGHTAANTGLQAIRMTHGRLDPMAMIGHAMGVRAMDELGIEPNSPSLAVVQQTPSVPAYSPITDGILAACTTTGELKLSVEDASPDELLVIFTDRLSGRQVVFQLLPEVANWLERVDPDQTEETTMRIAATADEALFVTSVFDPDVVPAEYEAEPFGGRAVCAAIEPDSTQTPGSLK